MNSPTKQHVDKFGEHMERKLAVNRHKGDRPGWLRCDEAVLLARLAEEVGELVGKVLTGATVQEVIDEAADVGNFAMMIADKYAYENSDAFESCRDCKFYRNAAVFELCEHAKRSNAGLVGVEHAGRTREL